MSFGKFFLPGPTEVKPEILAAMTRPMISHRGSEIEAIMTRIDERLQTVFRTTEPVFTVTSSATVHRKKAARAPPTASETYPATRQACPSAAPTSRATTASTRPTGARTGAG